MLLFHPQIYTTALSLPHEKLGHSLDGYVLIDGLGTEAVNNCTILNEQHLIKFVSF